MPPRWLLSAATSCLLPALLLGNLPSASAVFADEAYKSDFHLSLIGYPRNPDLTFFQAPYSGSKGSLLYTVTDKNVIAAVNPKDGSTVWRQLLEHNSSSPTESFLRPGPAQDVVVSGSGHKVEAWSAADGKQAWRNDVKSGQVRDVEVLQIEEGKEGAEKDVLALVQDEKTSILKRLNGKTGEVVWESLDTSGDIPFQLSSSLTTIFVVSYTSTLIGGNVKVKVASYDPQTGRNIDKQTLSTEIDISHPENIFVGANSAAPVIVWADTSSKTLKVNVLGSKSISSFSIDSPTGEEIRDVSVHAPHQPNALPHFLVHYQTGKTHWAEVFHINVKKGKVTKAYDLPKLSGTGAFSVSTIDANVYFTRVTDDEIIIVSSASHGILSRWPKKPVVPATQRLVLPHAVQASSEVVAKPGNTFAVRSVVLYSDGDWKLVKNGEEDWIRPEALAYADEAVFVDPPEDLSLALNLEVEGHENVVKGFFHRAKRHLHDLQSLPARLEQLPQLVLGSFFKKSESILVRGKRYGFDKILAIATTEGRLLGLDFAEGGKVMWNINLKALDPNEQWSPVKLDTAVAGTITVQGYQSKKVLEFNATTGLPLTPEQLVNRVAVATPETPARLSVYYDFSEINNVVQGYQSPDGIERQELWTFQPPPGERIIVVTSRAAHDPVASIGRVLGDRRVLYKYLNPNLVLITSVSEASGKATFTVLDGVSSNVLHTSTHVGVDTSQPIPAILSENWLAYSFTLNTSSSAASAKGSSLTFTEFYESSIPDDRGPLGASDEVSSVGKNDLSLPHVVSASYLIPHPLSYLTTTSTLQGITTRSLLGITHSSDYPTTLYSLPTNALSARRPVGRDPTPQEAMEGLSRYAPVFDLAPPWAINHKREIWGLKKVISSPSGLESTSLVFAWGLDLFGTVTAPSGTFDMLGGGFDKIQMLITVAGLWAGVLGVAPFVRRKQINTPWQMS
ncbi:DUF1620-domain-containing protein [Eremomyces bilateralis CBS 781.70]|uniref:ER membrane protein complex subunit 1 n=1 Tax=Eremomyces bilateralis CBS 781.70 TaxID=1392243 RepID=A0A6G1GER5_9PEZI|nr:DUF1620-domain-containing protein [Eremomyces bilateralis CBS 781.70]KAF1816406.1 DUF1620-domain-containing protein [Eremomyces bilateralis CBS 781.70]